MKTTNVLLASEPFLPVCSSDLASPVHFAIETHMKKVQLMTVGQRSQADMNKLRRCLHKYTVKFAAKRLAATDHVSPYCRFKNTCKTKFVTFTKLTMPTTAPKDRDICCVH